MSDEHSEIIDRNETVDPEVHDESADELLKAKIEALLFATIDTLSIKQLMRLSGEESQKKVREVLTWLQAEYAQQNRGIQILEVAGGYQMATKPEHADMVEQLAKRQKRQSLSPAAFETLAIIAYKQPLIRAEIESIRGVDSGGVIRTLVDMGLVTVVGRKEVIGRPPLYGTSKEFLKMFGLKSLSDLSSIQDLKEMFEQK